MRFERVFLAGTTTNTTWREGVIRRLTARGVPNDMIYNPHLPKGVSYSVKHMLEEEAVQRQKDPATIILIYICPAVVDDNGIHPAMAQLRRETLGPISMAEVGRYGWAEPQRTAIVFETNAFPQDCRAQKVLNKLTRQLLEDFQGPQPYFYTLAAAEDWIVTQLLGKP